MKRILVVLAEFYPYPSSNTNCIEPFLYGLLKKGYDVDVITRKHTVNLPTHENYKGINIIRIDDYKTMNTIEFNSLLRNNCSRGLRIFNKILANISKILFYIYYRGMSGEQRYGGWDLNEVIRVCHELNKKKPYEYILSISHPIVTHKIAKTLKKEFLNEVKWIIFEFDPFTYNIDQYGKYNINKRLSQECEFFAECDKIFLTPELYNYYKGTPLGDYRDKFCEVNFPNMSRICLDIDKSLIKRNDKRSHCVYGGALLKSIRNPAFMLNFFYELKDDVAITLMSSSRVKFIQKKMDSMKDMVTFYAGQPKEIAQATMFDSDILINIGNTVVFQTPGKIFEYMSMGKPIIHFSKIEKDPALKYLNKYPMLFVVREYCYDLKTDVEDCKAFISKYSGKTLDFDAVAEHMPELNSEFIVGKFVEEITNL